MEKIITKYGLPPEVKFCKKCVYSNQRPSTTVEFNNVKDAEKETLELDEEGVCSACRFAEYKEKIDWKKREEELMALCDKHRGKNGHYDCIVPGSGGKDSSFAAHILKYKYGMNPLTCTWAPHLYTDIGWKNMMSWIHIGGFDNVLFSPNGRIHSLLTKLAFENLLHPFQPFIIGQKNIAPKTAVLYNIPLIFYGENPAEFGSSTKSGDMGENDSPIMKKKFFASDIDLNSIFLGGVSVQDLMDKYGLSKNDINPYLPVLKEDAERVGIEVHYLGYYLKFDSQENYYYAAQNTGFQANVERTEGSYSKYSSIDDKVDPFHHYTTFIKFGLGRASFDAAQEIRNGKITREEGVTLVRRFDQEFPQKYFKEFLEYINISEEKFWEVINGARSPHLWENINGKWILKHQVS